ncbi:MAG TPA: multicopper oxidase domain-containing protein [Longimicrobium sp.]|nr:multicopper oxidase domain-containing protein [Longimicrobium sp.]
MRRESTKRSNRRYSLTAAAALLLALGGAAPLHAQCTRTKVAKVAALEQIVWYNRLGAHEPNALLFALEGDVVNGAGTGPGSTGNARMRDGRRPRPLVLRVNAGECLKITLRNLLSPTISATRPDSTRHVSIHVVGMQLVTSIADDGSAVQQNASSLVAPGASRTYTLFAEREGTYLLHSAAQMTGGEGDGGQIGRGLFGAVNVEPPGAEYYRSQVTRADLGLADPTAADSLHYPQVDYAAVYGPGHPLQGRPILSMLKGDTIVWSDLSAIITGPGRGSFNPSAYPRPSVPVYPQRLRPFREHTVIFHDEVGLVQAFDAIFDSVTFKHTLHGGRDAFAINYGSAGIGAEILANRFGLGPMGKCNDCKFEEFFLSSWAVGDPAMVLNNPAAAAFDPANPGASSLHPNAKVLYPDDPSNVFHSYLNDRVKIRNLHAGPKEHHIFHLHAHQWLNTPNDSMSNYKDSQAIGPGGGYTYEIAYGGGGNRNDTPGDAIFHCHFYPHFAQGMWGLWRNHDVFERGSVLDNGRVVTRGLPDGEITAGTPIPAVVPIPGYVVAPLPTAAMPGFPFYIPGVAGHRPPQPPLDLAFDGGLPRHVVTGGIATFPALNTRDFSKHDSTLAVTFLPDSGTVLERAAMGFHSVLNHPGPVADDWTATGNFKTNGLDPVPGAPFADPCGIAGDDSPVAGHRVYRAAGFQVTAQYNKAGWSFGQHRMFALWRDVAGFASGTRAPEPLFFRAHTGTCITYHLVNLIPAEYALDDFQVRTPTDIIGQHIHLVKFDVTSSDGAANGFNYEDGALAPDAVREVIRAIRRRNGCTGLEHGDPRDGDATGVCPKARQHPFFTDATGLGAQENVQRWWVDPVPRAGGDTSALPAVFTHDHFGPSTHQQTGLYAGLLPEAAETTWRDPETGVVMGTRDDGGPTSWRADIIHSANSPKNHREFGIQIADFALAYGAEGFAGSAGRTPPINPPGRDEPGIQYLLRPPLAPGVCPNGIDAPPCPEIVSADDPGTMLINYRNEPLALRVRDPAANAQAAGAAGDLSLAYANRPRADGRLTDYGPYGQRPGERQRDPFTPLLRIYENDRVSIRLLVGAHEEGHNWGMSGGRWFFERLSHNSGLRASQMAGISEWFEFNVNPLLTNRVDTVADFQYRGGSAVDDQWNGQWGIIRAYRTPQRGGDTLLALTTGSRSASLEAARLDSVAARRPRPDSVVAVVADSLPDPNLPASWTGGLPALDAARPSIPASLLAAFDAGTATPDDSVRAGYGNRAVGGLDAESFEYDPVLGKEYLATDEVPPAGSGFLAAPPGGSEAEEPSGAPTYQRQSGANVGFWGVCPRVAPVRYFEVAAIAASALPGGRLVYNTRATRGGPLHDPTAVVYVYDADLRSGELGRNPDPLVLRVNAGDCVLVRLRNRLPAELPDLNGWNTLPMIVDRFNANQVLPSSRVGLHPQLLSFDVQYSDASQVGLNRNTTVAPGEWRWYQWYAGRSGTTPSNPTLTARPMELGVVNLVSPDRIQHSNKGAIAALVVEPRKTWWVVDPANRAAASVFRRNGAFGFHEQVLLFQNDVNLRFGSAVTLPVENCDLPGADRELCAGRSGIVTQGFAAGSAVPNVAEAEDPEDSGQKGLNYRTEPMWFRKGFAPNARLGFTRTLNLSQVLQGDSAQTPIFVAPAGDSVRLRVVEPGGHARNHVFVLHGHVWEQEPYGKSSGIIAGNPVSEWKGARDGHGPGEHFEVVPRHGAGGLYQVQGDYLFRDQASFGFDGGIWGVMRVVPPSAANTSGATGGAACTVNPQTGATACN